MAETRTLNYSWTKPDPGASANTWGATLNATTDKIDAQVFLNQGVAASGGTYVGFINMFAGSAPPTNWLWCDSTLYAQTAWPALYAAIGTAFNVAGDATGFFRVPNLANGRTPIGQGGGYALGAIGGEATHVLSAAEMPTHSHGVSDPTHYHTLQDSTHAHGITQNAHGHGVSDPQHTHSLSNSSGVWSHVGGGGPGGTYVGNNMADASIAYASTGISISGSYANIPGNVTNNATFPNPYTDFKGAGISLGNAGGGATHNNMQPYCVVGFIIRAA